MRETFVTRIKVGSVALLLLLAPVTVWAEIQTYTVDESASRITFSAHSTGHDFQGETGEISGRFGLDRTHIGEGVFGDIHIAVKGIHTGIAARDSKMYQHFAADQYPDIFLRVQRVFDVRSGEGTTHAGQLLGALSIRGITKTVSISVSAAFPDSQTIIVAGSTPLDMTEFGVEPPGFLLFHVDKDVQIDFRIVGRAQ